jgi:hypothetical protein
MVPPFDPERSPGGPQGPHRRRRRRRRGERRDTPAPRPAPPVVPEPSRLATAAAGDAPLTPEEVTEMKAHLAFLRRYKDALRLKLNSAEDLLVNGQREPAERGVCRHLLGKLDRTVIERAIEREPLHSDAAARARMLAGAIRVTADVGVLLLYLEALAHVRSHAEAAQAFGEVVQRIDFEALSATRLARLLQVLIDTFTDHERVQVLFSLLAGERFRRAFDAAAATFPPAVAEVCGPLRAVHRRLTGEGGGPEPGDLLARGMAQVLSAPDPVLRGYAEPVRAALVELAIGADVPPALADRAAGVLLPSLARSGRPYARLALRRAAALLARHADDQARGVLEELRRARPDSRAAERWLAALAARRFGRIALAGEPPARGRLVAGFWLDAQRPVWLRTATAPEAERLAGEARRQAGLALPGVAPVVEHGVAHGIPYVAVAGVGRPLTLDAPLAPAAALALAAAVARVLRALALAGVALPDAEPERFLGGGAETGAVLADLDGTREAAPEEASAAHAALARKVVARLLPEQAATFDGGDLVALVDALDRSALRTARE